MIMPNIYNEDALAGGFDDMKFDVIVGNPPFNGVIELHQQIFNKSVDTLLKEDGIIAFIQPATPYFNKKNFLVNKQKHNKKMQDIILTYQTNVITIPPTHFKNVGISTDLAITYLRKTKNKTNRINSWTDQNNIKYDNVLLKHINQNNIPPDLYESIINKIDTYILNHGSLHNVETRKASVPKLALPMISGGKFYSNINLEPDTNHTFGINIDKNNYQNAVHYFDTKIARFCLSLWKYNSNNHRGEFRVVPLVDFNKKWDDQSLKTLFNFTDHEYEVIISKVKD